METPVFSPAAFRTSRRSSGAAAIYAAALAVDRVGVGASEKAKRTFPWKKATAHNTKTESRIKKNC